MKKLFLIALATLLVSPLALVRADTQEARNVACADKDEGDACEFTNGQGETANGSCKNIASGNGKLTCVEYLPGN